MDVVDTYIRVLLIVILIQVVLQKRSKKYITLHKINIYVLLKFTYTEQKPLFYVHHKSVQAYAILKIWDCKIDMFLFLTKGTDL